MPVTIPGFNCYFLQAFAPHVVAQQDAPLSAVLQLHNCLGDLLLYDEQFIDLLVYRAFEFCQSVVFVRVLGALRTVGGVVLRNSQELVAGFFFCFEQGFNFPVDSSRSSEPVSCFLFFIHGFPLQFGFAVRRASSASKCQPERRCCK